ncbi:GTP cyclohydrolase II [Arthrobacter sp. CAN_A6]|uniref:GTP cyclohydrolase II n=1 Tax=Arthrobacter sp. CAN_A6 TaxID=2787721 RepID=UPI0018C91EAD
MPTQLDPVSVPATVERVAETLLPTKYGLFRLVGYRDAENIEHVALMRGIDEEPASREILSGGARSSAPLVRVHSECLTGDALGSYRCDCGEQLDAALHAISEEGHGVLVYVRGHEGRGIGLLAKLKAYALQDAGVDTVDANTSLGLPVDSRNYNQAADILQDLGVSRIRLLSANPAKQEALEELGITVVERRGLAVPERAENAAYLATKRARMRHDRPAGDDVWQQLLSGFAHPVAGGVDDEDLVHRYGFIAATQGPLVLAHLRQSLDGFIASRSGDDSFPGAGEDHGHLDRLRALVDAVVVGVGTVLADDCSLTVQSVRGPNPARVVLDPSGSTPVTARVLTDDAAATVWMVGVDAVVPDDLARSVSVVRVGDGGFEPAAVLSTLREMGFAKVLLEGGGKTVSRFLSGGCLDRLYLTTAPVLVGDGVPGIRFTGSEALADARTAPVRRFLLGQDVCTEFNFGASV